jgi:hypothetical protein
MGEIAAAAAAAAAATTAPSRPPMVQEEFYDSIGWPWRYDPDVGVIIAAARDGEGDGAYRFATDPETGRLVTEKNSYPTDVSVFQQRRDASLERVMVLVRAAAAAADADAEDASSSEAGEDAGEEAETPPAPPSRQRRVTDHALAGCTITTLVRATTGRTDLLVVTPDGRSFRSKVAALRYLEGA